MITRRKFLCNRGSYCFNGIPFQTRRSRRLSKLAAYYLTVGNSHAADEIREQMLTRFPKSPTSLRYITEQGETLYKAQKYADAVALWQKKESALQPEFEQH
jgi:hypothetical protein